MHCREEKIPEGSEFPKVWEWLSDPKTTKEDKTVNGTTYIVYTGQASSHTVHQSHVGSLYKCQYRFFIIFVDG